MARISAAMLLFGALLATAPLQAQEPKVFDVTRIAENLYEPSADGGGYPIEVIAGDDDGGPKRSFLG